MGAWSPPSGGPVQLLLIPPPEQFPIHLKGKLTLAPGRPCRPKMSGRQAKTGSVHTLSPSMPHSGICGQEPSPRGLSPAAPQGQGVGPGVLGEHSSSPALEPPRLLPPGSWFWGLCLGLRLLRGPGGSSSHSQAQCSPGFPRSLPFLSMHPVFLHPGASPPTLSAVSPLLTKAHISV